ncbi:MAG: hypothetical protein QOE80_3303 [Actinomycetota bacterium]|jgi:enoyl-CoA hydratase/carnithine racemase|nr:hypothetical protein [Actinomycetota bacterium]
MASPLGAAEMSAASGTPVDAATALRWGLIDAIDP